MVKLKDFILNGRTVQAPENGPVAKQLNRFKEIEDYARAQEKLKIKTAESQSKKHPAKRDFVVQMDSDKYEITAINTAVPVPFLIIRGDSWDAMIKDKTNGSTEFEHAGIAKLYFDLLNSLRDAQK